MNFPCPTAIKDCPFPADDPLSNLTAEAPDGPLGFPGRWPRGAGGGGHRCFSFLSADVCSFLPLNTPQTMCGFMDNGFRICISTGGGQFVDDQTALEWLEEAVNDILADAEFNELFDNAFASATGGLCEGADCNTEQASDFTYPVHLGCGSVFPLTISFTIPAGMICACDLTSANAAANLMLQLLFAGFASVLDAALPEMHGNAATSCTLVCADGTPITFTVFAGAFCSLTESDANYLANWFACVLATFGCAGEFPDSPYGAFTRQYKNTAQTCQVECADGSFETYTVPANTFIGSTQAAANAAAHAFACQQAQAALLCLSEIVSRACLGSAYTDSITVSGGVGPYTYDMTAGSLPPGISLNLASGTLTGTPTVPGGYNFTVQVTDSAFNASTPKNFTLDIVGITTTSLPGGSEDTDYVGATISQTGFGAPVFSITAGTLPDGLSMDASGVISGHVGVGATGQTFTVRVQEGAFFCERVLGIAILELEPIQYWAFESGPPYPNSISGEPDLISVGETTPTSVPGVVGNGTRLVCLTDDSQGAIGALFPSSLLPAAQGFTITGWVKVSSTTEAFKILPAILLFKNDFSYFAQVQVFYDPLNDSGQGGPNIKLRKIIIPPEVAFSAFDTGFSPTAGAWLFFALWSDPVADRIGLQINNGPVTDVPGIILSTSADDVAFSLNCSHNPPDTSPPIVEVANAVYDEVAIFDKVLNSDELTFIYNGGAGRTYPW